MRPRPQLLAEFVIGHGAEGSPLKPPNGTYERLTPREQHVLGLIASGHSNAEISEALFLSRSTVTRHVSNIYSKLGIHNRAQATAAYFGHANEGRRATT